MNMDPQTLNVIGTVIVLAVLALAVWFVHRRNESHRLAQHFGPEYGRAVHDMGSRTKAEAELKTRERRFEKLNIVPLAPADAEHFSREWLRLQSRFVDNPKGVLIEADALVRELMQKRGYPMGDFDSRAADISVAHPHVVDHYRAAQAIAMRDRRGEADTEELRKAVVHYRALFEDLLETRKDTPAAMREMERKEMERHA
jgi:hypothetical protein